MLSEQLDKEFFADNYDEMKKVHSIWICMEAPEKDANTITGCRTVLLSDEIDAETKKRELEGKHGMIMTEEVEGGSRSMAKLEKTLYGKIDELAEKIKDGVLNRSTSASLEDISVFNENGARCIVYVFERYSI